MKKTKVLKNFDKKKQRRRKEQKGITLIALVITIIVLLILAAVSIATLTGENGILTKAQKAKTETEKASEEEQIQLAALNAAMNTERYNYQVEDGTVPIPAGFAPTQIEGQNSIKDGVVVVDENGNEFVWIPCDIAAENGIGETTADGKINYNAKRNEDWKSYQWCYNGGRWGDSQPNKPEIQKSISENKGFYIGRYEAGIPSNAPFYANKNGDTYYTAELLEGDEKEIMKNTSAYKPVSKRGVQAWNFIEQKNAELAAKSMVTNSGIQSYLIDSHAWDTMCRVIAKYTNKNLTNSLTWGNYKNNTTTKYEDLNTLHAVHTFANLEWKFAKIYNKGQVTEAPKGDSNNTNRIELSTGASEDFKAYNIYDLAGNMHEWTTEKGIPNGDDGSAAEIPEIEKVDILEATNGVLRGGNTNNDEPVVFSNAHYELNLSLILSGFRVVLYLS